MLAQQHPEYVSLAWGTMKLIFVLIMNFDELVTELAKALSKIAEVLPRTDIHLELYPTDSMKTAVTEIYAHIIIFYQRALRWYEASPLKRMVGVIVKPYKLHFEDIVKEINWRARSIDLLADALAQKEIREISIVLRSGLLIQGKIQDDQAAAARELRMLQQANQIIMGQLELVHQKLNEHQAINHKLLQSTQQSTTDTQFALMIRSAASPLTSPIGSLRVLKAALSHHIAAVGAMKRLWRASTLECWSSTKQSELLLMIGSSFQKPGTRAAGICLIDLIKSSGAPILWALKTDSSSSSCTAASTVELLRYLAWQALQLSASTLNIIASVSANFNAARIASAASEEDWLDIIRIALSNHPRVFLVIDADFLNSATRDASQLAMLITMLSQISTPKSSRSILKTVVVSSRKTSMGQILQSESGLGDVQTMYIDRFLRKIQDEDAVGEERVYRRAVSHGGRWTIMNRRRHK
ncbi:hypothetical protein EJ03DRAFT_326027 [Teratosphaeria nubilosa]|uniref:DUF7708 domain-containing protein n=1 Tax=Teratosphaeria nubilosa TaxID=161662 RepID=A0A6G1LEV4_9PEZI|nr:hypothetical protein EJ03DRAFT_326027 [Teratosphaeria nubilosa]